MQDLYNTKILGIVAALAFIMGIITLVYHNLSYSVLLLTLAVVLGLLALNSWNNQRKREKNHYHAVHWENGRIYKDK